MNKRLGIMQPYFLPYIGYWQLLKACDEFIVYDQIQYTKKGWINRNRFLLNGGDNLFSIPLKKDSDFKDIRERLLADSFDRGKLLRQFRESYLKAPYFKAIFPLLEQIVMNPQDNLFDYILHSIKIVANHLNITTPLIISSTLAIDRDLKNQDKVIALCKSREATSYLNPIGGVDLYDPALFKQNGIELGFLKTGDVQYPQFGNVFVPHLSIIDVMMFNDAARINEFLGMWDQV